MVLRAPSHPKLHQVLLFAEILSKRYANLRVYVVGREQTLYNSEKGLKCTNLIYTGWIAI